MLRVAATARCEYFESVDRRLVGEKTHAKVKGTRGQRNLAQDLCRNEELDMSPFQENCPMTMYDTEEFQFSELVLS